MVIGQHQVTHGSIADAQVDAMLARSGQKVWVLYSDPPWGDGNLAYWKTMNKKMTGQDAAQVTHDQILDRYADLIREYVAGYVFIETGKRWIDPWVATLGASGIANIRTQRIWYKSGARLLENVLIYGNKLGLPPAPIGDIEALRGFAIPDFCVKSVAKPGALAFDPCCGMGYTAKAATNNGMVFCGNELNGKRLEKTIAHLKATVR